MDALNLIDKTIIVIGEGWNMGTLPSSVRASQTNISKLPGVAHFNDQIRDGIKGSVFTSSDPGFATGKFTAGPDVVAGIVANTDYSPTLLSKWTTSAPGQSVNYVESHDNLTLADKITASVKGVSPAGVAQLSQFAASIAFLSQGVPFIQAGQEFLRSKNGDENSYKSDDATNSIKWSTKAKFASTFKYYQGLIALRSAHPALRMTTTAQIKANLKFLKFPNDVIGYSINSKSLKDKAATIIVIHNPNAGPKNLVLPNSKKWSVLVQGAIAGNKVIRSFTGNKVTIAGQSTLVVTQ